MTDDLRLYDWSGRVLGMARELAGLRLEAAHLREVLGLRDAEVARLEAEAAFLRRAVADVGGGLWFAVAPDAVREGT